MAEAEKITNEDPMSEGDRAELEAMLTQIEDDPFDLWIGTKDNYLYQAQGTFDNDTGKNKLKDITFDISLFDYNKAVNIDAPADAKEFDLFGGGDMPMMNMGEMDDMMDEMFDEFDPDDLEAQLEDLERMLEELEQEYN
jgi:hypothetical protein